MFIIFVGIFLGLIIGGIIRILFVLIFGTIVGTYNFLEYKQEYEWSNRARSVNPTFKKEINFLRKQVKKYEKKWVRIQNGKNL